MNHKSLILGLSIAAAAASVSAESYTEYNTPFVSTASPVAVLAKDVPATSSVNNPSSTSYNPLAGFQTDRGRRAVQSEYIEDRERVAAFTGEDSGSAYLSGRPAAAGETFAATASSRIVR
ncbi:hypothetical protein H8N03_00630 [Ramlibacter sp. USB13]|uniref:DUF4148 domain-containing protein n=1 Tax=Ramlibacter cellulosilyticus TaxID=2764187 RepID=A0A923MLW6_9BURK|nr:hypothetical protein [Ramlibacter cellulosilyticus]MBC5781425.1 hypothetical protein [Ramlibacter cellulosilyticus]